MDPNPSKTYKNRPRKPSRAHWAPRRPALNGPESARTILDPFCDPKRAPQNTQKSVPGLPRDAQEGLKVQKTRLQKPLLVKIDIEHDFEYFWIGI